jgi:DNA-binding transcriptional MerR regulator
MELGTGRTYSSVEVCRALGISYRMLDYECKRGRIPGQEYGPGSGSPRVWTVEQVEKLREIVEARRAAKALLEGAGLARDGFVDGFARTG